LRASDLNQDQCGGCKTQIAGNARKITLNTSAEKTTQALLALSEYSGDKKPLFCSQGGTGTLSVPSINHLVKGWCRELNLKDKYGSHTLSKTL
jgi:hypothetical protein